MTRTALALAFVSLLDVAPIPGCGGCTKHDRPLTEPAAAAPAPTPPIAPAPNEIDAPYDENADAERDLQAALKSSSDDGKPILLVFGANWCKWCRRLEWTIRNDARVSARLAEGFRVVHVDVGPRSAPRNLALNERYGHPVQHGLPVIVALDAQGELMRTQETGALETGEAHDPDKVLAFLASLSQGASR